MPAKIHSQEKPSRRKRGFQRVSSLLQREFRTVGQKRGFAVARLLTHWAEIVGADVARIARPVNVSYSKGKLRGTLVLLTPSPHAPILSMKLESIRERVNACYGYSAISDISIRQTTLADFADGAPVDEPTRKPIPEPDPFIRDRVRRAVADVSDDGLRHALELLGEGVLTKLNRK